MQFVSLLRFFDRTAATRHSTAGALAGRITRPIVYYKKIQKQQLPYRDARLLSQRCPPASEKSSCCSVKERRLEFSKT